MEKTTLDFIDNLSKVALAVSGGKDSMTLLDLFENRFDKSKFFVLTVHHNLRGKEGMRDRDFVIDYCKNHNIECMVFEEDIPSFCDKNGYTIEQGARIRRRKIFEDIVKSGKAQRVATAHHMDDQVESILMHIFRGSGIKGLCGMPFDDGILIRPLLDMSRKDIDQYVANRNLAFVEDSTNECVDYTRNKLRKQILPLIAEAYAGYENNIVSLGKRASQAFKYIDKGCHDFCLQDGEVVLPISLFSKEDIIVRHTLINAVDSITTRVDLTSKHLDMLINLASKQNGARVDLPFGLTAHKQKDCLVLALTKQVEYKGQICGYGEYIVGDRILVVAPQKTQFTTLCCDMDKLDGALIRNRKKGDNFKRYKGGNKSLGDYLTDIKVPKRKRDSVIVLAKENIVYALPEYEIGDIVKVREDTKKVAYLHIK